ncbi:MAG: hypothetical protein HY706_17680 [Candidatus Hydrogenedentes bacterium]|nr:hypothetical protein [Candidatus Hydrogenedentota bacterium]
MYEDAVITELWLIKDENAKRYGYDVHRIGEALRSEQAAGIAKVVSFAEPKARAREDLSEYQ